MHSVQVDESKQMHHNDGTGLPADDHVVDSYSSQAVYFLLFLFLIFIFLIIIAIHVGCLFVPGSTRTHMLVLPFAAGGHNCTQS